MSVSEKRKFHAQVANIAVRAALQSSGQNCAGAERFYVHKDIYSAFLARIVKIVKSVSVVSNILTHSTAVSKLNCRIVNMFDIVIYGFLHKE